MLDMFCMYMIDDELINEKLIRKEIRMWRFGSWEKENDF